jgi:hypothetical protein
MTIRERAEEYVGLLDEGSTILDDTDGAVVAPFKHLLAPLLWLRKRLYLVRIGDRQLVTKTPVWLLQRLRGTAPAPDQRAVERDDRMVCRKCNGAFFDCGCGEGAIIVVAPVQPPVFPWIISRRKAAA